MRLVLLFLIIHIIVSSFVYWKLYQLNTSVVEARETLNGVAGVLDGIRVTVAGSVSEKAHLIKDGYWTLKDQIKTLLK